MENVYRDVEMGIIMQPKFAHNVMIHVRHVMDLQMANVFLVKVDNTSTTLVVMKIAHGIHIQMERHVQNVI